MFLGLETKFKNLEAEVIAQEKVASEINKKYEVKFKEAEKKSRYICSQAEQLSPAY